MCNPVAMFAVSTAVSIGSTVIGAMSQKGAAAQKVGNINAEADAINRSTIFRYATAGLQEQQAQAEATLKEGQARMRLSGAEGEAAAAAGSGGVTGNSVRQLYRSFNVATGHDVMSIEADEQGKIAQSETQKKSDQMSAQNQILGLQESLPQDPSASIVGDVVKGALGVGDAFTKYTTPITDKSQMTGGLFGGGGFLGTGRQFG